MMQAVVTYTSISREDAAARIVKNLRDHDITAKTTYDREAVEQVVFVGQDAPGPMAFKEVYSYLRGLMYAEMEQPSVKVVVLDHGKGLPLPSYETEGSAGMDLRAAIDEDVYLLPGQRKLIPTGIKFAIPEGYEAQVRGRSGLAVKHGIGMVNGVGTIDSDYRGELGVIMINHGQEMFPIRRGDRIAQLVISPVVQTRWVETDSLDDTVRGAGGYGSTGHG